MAFKLHPFLIHSQVMYNMLFLSQYAAFTQKHVFNYYDSNDVFGCVADIGWITGHSYVVYGPLVNGGTSLLFESTPNFPGVNSIIVRPF